MVWSRISPIAISALLLKAWCELGTLLSAADRGILRIEFKRFLVSFVPQNHQSIATGLRPFCRILACNRHLGTFLLMFNQECQLKFT
jgi:hypothetical protein